MERIPTAILMSGTGSNARRLLEFAPADPRGAGSAAAQRREPHYEIRVIVSDNPDSNYLRIAREHGVEAELNDIYSHFGIPRTGRGLDPADRGKLKDPTGRERFDRRTGEILERYGIRLAALAGYDWVIAPFLCRDYLVVNVHPGDLRVRDEAGHRPYIGLGWVPTAKAILAGERCVHATTHLVTAELDGGPIARVSDGVPIDLPEGATPANLLPPGIGLAGVIRAARTGDDSPLAACLLVTHSKAVQERLKRAGDWVEFPRTLDQVAGLMRAGRLERRSDGAVLLDGEPVEDLFLQRLEAEEDAK
jgi:folate-dependent phosphoribosylglycinamide formyltransferase PurN